MNMTQEQLDFAKGLKTQGFDTLFINENGEFFTSKNYAKMSNSPFEQIDFSDGQEQEPVATEEVSSEQSLATTEEVSGKKRR